MKKLVFVVNGDWHSPAGYRARAFAHRLGEDYQIRLCYRSAGKLLSSVQMLAALQRFRPDLCYVVDMAWSGVLAAGMHRHLTGCPLVIDTGDAIGELARALDRGRLGIRLTCWFERYAQSVADKLVVRGSYHRELLAKDNFDAAWIPDGVDCQLFAPQPVGDLKLTLGLDGLLTVGLVGSSIWSQTLGICYGWDLIEVIRRLRDRPVAGIMIGGGSGISILKQRCREYGIADRVRFLGYVPFEQLPSYLNLIDICLLTQTNDLVGQVRTTGKLPLYLATGRYILASNVGEAARVLPAEMRVDYQGVVDRDYPGKLAERIGKLIDDPAFRNRAQSNCDIARSTFEYSILTTRLSRLIDEVIAHHPRPGLSSGCVSRRQFVGSKG